MEYFHLLAEDECNIILEDSTLHFQQEIGDPHKHVDLIATSTDQRPQAPAWWMRRQARLKEQERVADAIAQENRDAFRAWMDQNVGPVADTPAVKRSRAIRDDEECLLLLLA